MSGPRILLVAVAHGEQKMLPDEQLGDEAKVMAQKFADVARYARAFPFEAEKRKAFDVDPGYSVKVGCLLCTFTHQRLPDGMMVRHLTIQHKGEGGCMKTELPPPYVAHAVATGFGFTGEMDQDYVAGVHDCDMDPPCSPRCPDHIECVQHLPLAN